MSSFSADAVKYAVEQASQSIESDEEPLLAFFYMCPVGILQIDGQGVVQMLNPMAAQLLMPIRPDGVIQNLFDVLERCAPDLRNMVASYQQLSGRICDNRRLFVGTYAGQLRILTCTMLKTSANCIMVMLDDISIMAAKERQLHEADSWMAAIFSNVNDFACFSLDDTGLINSWNPSGVRQTGLTASDVVGQPLDIFRPGGEQIRGQTVDYLNCARREGWHLHEDRCLTRDGESFWCQILITALEQGDVGAISGFSVILRDVTERKMTTDELRRLLTTDHLTGAANRVRFFEAAAAEIAASQRCARPVSVLMIDADNFKRINDTMGHPGGDFVLQAVVARMQPILRSIDILARYGGEEFVILLPGTDITGALEVAERICHAVDDELVAFDHALIHVTVSIGCVSMGQGIDDLDGLLKAADVALYQAKQFGRNMCCTYQRREQITPVATLSAGARALPTSAVT